jgi:xylulokinase
VAHALGIDVGSTNAKVALVDEEGRLVATGSRPIPTRRHSDVAEQEPEALWQAVVDAAAEATAAEPAAAADVVAVGVCSQYSSIVPVAADGRATADLVLYFDQRGTDHSWEVMARHPEAFEVFLDRHGIPPVGGGLSLAHILHLQLDRPDVHARTAAYLEPMDFVNLRLTGQLAATQCTMFTAQLCDNRALGVTAYDDELVRLSGVDADRLPPLVPLDSAIGPLLPDVVAALGVPAGATAYAAMNDSHAGAYATGAFQAGRGGLVVGTTAVLLDTKEDKGVDLDHEILSMPSPEPGNYLVWAENGVAGKAVEHVLANLVYTADELGDHATDDPFAALDRVLKGTTPGADGVLFLPWLAGSLSPDVNGHVRGGFLNLSLDTRRVHLVRSMVEGTALNLGRLLPVVEGFTGRRVEELVFGGGAARSAGWAQVMADVLDRPVRTLAHPDRAVARAAGLVALVRHGALARPDLDALVETTASYDPTPAHRPRYELLQAQFDAAFRALVPVYEALNGGAREEQP